MYLFVKRLEMYNLKLCSQAKCIERDLDGYASLIILTNDTQIKKFN